jgi:hypothetical protein
MAKLSEGSQISITSPRRRDFFIWQLSLIPSLHFFLLHHRSSPVSTTFLRGLQLHLLPVLHHVIVSIFFHCIVVSMVEPDLQAVLPHQVAPVSLLPELPHLSLPNPHVLRTPPQVDHHLTADLRPPLPPEIPPPQIRAIDVDR